MKILILASSDLSLINFRRPLIVAMRRAGHEVVACAPNEAHGVEVELRRLGVSFIDFPLRRTGLNPLIDAGMFFRLILLLRQQRPDLLFSYTIKPVIFGSLAGAVAGVPNIFAMITGLGAAFSETASWWLRKSATALYRISLVRCRKIFVQNQDIAEYFVQKRIAPMDKIVRVNGSGVDLVHFKYVPATIGGPAIFLLLARLIKDKGIHEYIAAARLVKARFPEARFYLAGAIEAGSAAISLNEVVVWQNEGLIEYLPFQNDVRDLLSMCTAYVLPSYYLEGVPRSILEAMAIGRAIVTTNSTGCRETVKIDNPDRSASGTVVQGQNGFLVKPRSVSALVEAMLALAANRVLAEKMGRRSREIAEEDFDAEQISSAMLRAMGVVLK